MSKNPPSNLSIQQYWENSPRVLIRDFAGNLYKFPEDRYNNGSGGIQADLSSSNITKGRLFNAITRNGALEDVWLSTIRIDPDNYVNIASPFGGTVSSNPDNNANDITKVNNLNSREVPSGYVKRSGGDANTSGSFGWLIAKVNDSSINYNFAVYTKMDNRLDFLNDLLKNVNANKQALYKIASAWCYFGNQRYENVCPIGCNNATDDESKRLCQLGADQWCRDDYGRIQNDFKKTGVSDSKCLVPLQSGAINPILNEMCKRSDVIGTEFCKDVRLNLGNNDLKNSLDSYLYNDYCSLDSNINNITCAEVIKTCNNTSQLIADTPPYNCNSLVKKLKSDSNRILLTSNLDFSKFADTNLKSTILNSFNIAPSNLVSDKLCSINNNAIDPVCQNYLSSNFSSLVKTNQTNPILLMYFSGSKFNNKEGMDSGNSLTITWKKLSTDLVGLNSTPIKLIAPWSAKLYTYLTPSSTGEYAFRVFGDDFAKVYINNNLIINGWDGVGCCRNYYSTYITLDPSKGPYLLYIEFLDTGGAAALDLKYISKASVGTNTITTATNYISFTNLTSTTPNNGLSPIPGLPLNTLHLSQFSPYTTITDARKEQSINYCTKNNRFASDINCTGNITNFYNGINSVYNSDQTFKTAMIDYCATDNKFATDSFCLGDVNLEDDYSNGVNKNPNIYDPNNTKINTAIESYCKLPINNVYNKGDSTANRWCKNTDTLNTINYKNPKLQSLNLSYGDTLRKTRLKYVQDAIAKSIETGGDLTQDVIDYINIDFINLQNNLGVSLYPESSIIDVNLLGFCENNDPNLKTPLCNTIYNNPRLKLSPNVISSQARINDIVNCIATKAFMGKSILGPDDPYNVSCKAKRDASDTYARYLPLAIQYCGLDDNIVSEECKSYYNNIQTNINDAMNADYANAGTKSTFTNNNEGFDNEGFDNEEFNNKESFSNDYHDYSIFILLLVCFILIFTYSRFKGSDISTVISSMTFSILNLFK